MFWFEILLTRFLFTMTNEFSGLHVLHLFPMITK